MSRAAVRTQKRRAAHAGGKTLLAEEVTELREQLASLQERLDAGDSADEPEALTEDPKLLAALAAVSELSAKSDDDEEEGDGDDDEDDQAAVAQEAFADTVEAQLPDEHQPQEQLPKRNPSPKAPMGEQPTNASLLRWEATFAPEGKPTDDGRMFWPGSIQWRELPLSLMAMTETSEGGHIGAELAGRIDSIYREGDLIKATGVFDDGDYGSEIARLVSDGTLRGLSVDIAAREYEIVPRAQLFDEEGNLKPDALDRPADAEEPDLLDILFGGEDMVFVVTDGVIGMATVCPFPAFEDAQISLSASGFVWTLTLQGGFTVTREDAGAQGEEGEPDGEAPLTAAAAGLAPLHPPAAWFDNPEFAELTPMTVSDDGRISGHAACWESCHIGIPGECVTAPHSLTNYAYYLLAEVETEEGETVATGKITLATNHADRRLARQAAAEHYDHSGTAVADVTCGEDEHGIWVAGALRPDVPAEKVRALRGSVLSGDWRNVNGNLELVALLAVNVPGFPIPRPRALVSSGEEGSQMETLYAAGIHDGRTLADLSEDDLARVRVLNARARGGVEAVAALVRGETA